ncbi:MAG: PilZ domain-containing protein [Pseudobutyrivibrio sp.]|nr:PilZ domain-containing protein [Pseudobutyrivibrio sp.]
MEISELKPGTPVEFTIASTNSDVESSIGQDRSVYISSVFGVTKKNEVVFHLPSRGGRTVTIPMNVPFNAVFNTGKTMYMLTGLITKRGRLEDFPVYVFEPEGDLKKVQRRNYFRLPCYIPAKILPIPREVALLPNMDMVEADLRQYGNTYGLPVSGTILDISGGGVRFKSSRKIDEAKYIYISFTLQSPTINKEINATARQVKTTYFEEMQTYEHRLEFLFKEPEDRETIIKYIFDEDRRLRKKEQG